jgi:hypothetical protein
VFIRERREPRGDEGAPGQRVGQARGDVVDGRAVRLARRRVVDEAARAGVPRPAEGDRALDEDDVARAEVARRERAAACVELESSTRLRCERMRQFRCELFGCASRTRREQSIRRKISRIDFDVIELERFEVFAGRGVPPVEFHTGRGGRGARRRRRP